MFTLFKVFMAKCILITFLYQSNKQSSKYQDGKMAKQSQDIQTSNHGIAATHNHENE
jgi:hypothetical protein